jgi:septal ring factor EnvC (AmiA/AmiB activator)
LIETLKKGDQTGLLHELQRIRQELVDRNEEVSGLGTKLATLEERLEQQSARATGLEQEKEALAAKALDSAAELRKANERIYDLEQGHGAAAQPQSPSTTAPMPAPPRVPLPPPQGSAGGPVTGATPPPRIPPPSRTPPPRTPPPPTPPPRSGRGSIFPPPRTGRGSKE